jgi:Ca2+-binding RTX toxin-like protein
VFLLFSAISAGVGGAGAVIPDGSIAGTVTNSVGASPCVTPFDSSHFVWVDAFDAGLGRHFDAPLSMVSDGTGVYQIPDLSPGLYKVRFRVWDGSAKLVAYWWYTDPVMSIATATRYEDGDFVAVVAGSTTTLDTCLAPLSGGWFKGTVSSSVAGFDPTCVNLMAYEAGSGIGIGIVNPVNATGRYRHHDDLPPGQYKALAFASGAAHCPDPRTFMDQWRKGQSGVGLMSMSNATFFESGATFTIGVGTVTPGVHFVLGPVGTCGRKAPTILGTSADDVITGTAAPDVIMTFQGNDEVYALGGNDTICTGRGRDLVYGGANNDRIFTQGGNDRAYGQTGKDMLNMGFGADSAWGGPGPDKIKGGGGDDTLYGGSGNDLIIGNQGDDRLYGQADDDTLQGRLGFDLGDGGLGIDTCNTEIKLNCP